MRVFNSNLSIKGKNRNQQQTVQSDKFRVISNFDYYYSFFSFEFSTKVYVIKTKHFTDNLNK